MEDKNQTNTTPIVPEGTIPEPDVVGESLTGTSDIGTVNNGTPTMVPDYPNRVSETSAADLITPSNLGNEESELVTMSEPAPLVRPVLIKQYAIATAIIVVIGLALFYALEQQGRIETNFFDSVTELVTPTPVAAVVNGVKIPLADYEKNKSQLEQAATQNGSDPMNESIAEQIKTQALDVLINTELLRQEAAKAGVTVSPEQIDARYQEIVTGLQGEDKLIARMAELGITKEGLMKDIEGEILIQTHLAAAIDTTGIVIDPKEIQTVYDQANTNPDSPLPPLEQVSSAIEAQIRTSKEQELVNAYIETLRGASSIEVKI